ncbi:hypothetical protein PVBG_05631 [Plasmodium vivax Brazil I]|uniref:Variable surface protein Vir35 n=1 Tax=Plasmodium vivax (strain Brazil I) TaxID=1033975 RepID=A0A0J9T0E7_PLAV1|nr:hypothetical protein PVBG_05631 [Plasmodium vivax Brazil I]
MMPLGNNNSSFPNSLEKIQEQDKILNIKYNRLLARYEKQRELQHIRLKKKISDDRWNKKGIGLSNNLLTYSEVKNKGSKNFDVYMKNYKNRYMKKKGLSKLDCYCENKVFRKFNNICDIRKKLKYDEKRSKSFFLKKYGIGLILFVLIPALGLIFPILFGLGDKNGGILGLCPGGTSGHFQTNTFIHKETPEKIKNCPKRWMYDYKDTISIFGDVSYIFSFIMIAMVLLVLFYILIKIIKSEKIKAGKGKMSVKEYCRFCKDIF